MMRQYYLAVDFGASGGRHILFWLEDGRICLDEIYRFENQPVFQNGLMCWDLERLEEQLLTGMKRCREAGRIPAAMGIDTWGLDYVLLDGEGKCLGSAVNHRDPRTKGIYEAIFSRIPEEELYGRTGIQTAEFNTLCQLMAVRREQPELLERARTFLMIPDYLNAFLTGEMAQEYTNATTTQLLRAGEARWDTELMELLGLPPGMFLPPRLPGQRLGSLKQEMAALVGFSCDIFLTPSHDTASAFLALPPGAEKEGPAISSGTWSLMGMEREAPLLTEYGRKRKFTNEGGYGGKNLLLKNSMGLWMIQNIRREAAPRASFAELCQSAEQARISSVVDCQAEEFLAPASMAEAVRQYCKKTGQPVPESPGELACVVYHSLAASYGKILREMETAAGTSFQALYIIGGGSNAEYLNRLTASCTGLPVYAGPAEATAIGNALSQMTADGVFPTMESARECAARSFERKRIVWREKGVPGEMAEYLEERE